MKKLKKNEAITLVALIVTIIMLLILAGITISTLGGENGLFARVKLGKERYAISEAKEKLELEITNLQIEQQGKGEELKKEDLPKMNNDEIDVRDTTNFPVEVIYKNYKFEVDSNFHVTYVGEANETIITYTTEPDGYTNQNKVKVLVKISNPKGIKSILKPGETDKILPQDRTTAGIEFTVTKNGHYILKVEDIDGNEVSKDIYIELIDTLAPGEFTPEIQKADSSITVIENGKDAEATEESCKSGIDHYEYYLIDSSNKETKYDTNKIENLALGSYKLYVVAFDKAGNNKKSSLIEFKLSIRFKMVDAGEYHTLAIDMQGNLWSCGNNSYGQLGDGTTEDKTSLVQIKNGTKFIKVVGGTNHSLALDESGNLWAWGWNNYGQLGDGTTENKTNPVQIKDGTKFKEIAGGYGHSLAIDENGNLWSWGYNSFGQLGDGTTENKTSPVQIKNGIQFKEISTGNYHNLALDENGNLWSWGYNSYGQLGDGTKTNRISPVQVKAETKFKEISNKILNHSLAIDENGNLWSWGYNEDGQLGDGTTENKTSPVQIKSGTKFKQITGGNHSLAIDENGKLWGFGLNCFGQLGDETTINKVSPIQIKKGIKFKQISNGLNQSFAIDESGSLWAWGWNNYGQLGDGTTVNKLEPVEIETKI